MSLFQCGRCGCCDNTATSPRDCDTYAARFYDWTGIEDRKGKKLCSACGPTKYSDGTPTEYGQWHGRFTRTYLPLGMFRTANNGNLEHVETGEQDYRKYAVAAPAHGVRDTTNEQENKHG